MRFLKLFIFLICSNIAFAQQLPTSISISPASPNLILGSEFSQLQFTAVAKYQDGHTEDITNKVIWTSSKSSVAAIKTNTNSAGIGAAGIAFSKKNGTTTISAKYNIGNKSLSNSTTLTISADPCPIQKAFVSSPLLSIQNSLITMNNFSSSTNLYLIRNGLLRTLHPTQNMLNIKDYASGAYVRACYSNKVGLRTKFSNVIEYAENNLTYMPDGTFTKGGQNNSNSPINTANNEYIRCQNNVSTSVSDTLRRSLAFKCSNTNSFVNLSIIKKTTATQSTLLAGPFGLCRNSETKANYCFCLGAKTIADYQKGLNSSPAKKRIPSLSDASYTAIKFSNYTPLFQDTYNRRPLLQNPIPNAFASNIPNVPVTPMSTFGFSIDRELPYQRGYVNIDIFTSILAGKDVDWLYMRTLFGRALDTSRLMEMAIVSSPSGATQDVINNRYLSLVENFNNSLEQTITNLNNSPEQISAKDYLELWPDAWLAQTCGNIASIPLE